MKLVCSFLGVSFLGNAKTELIKNDVSLCRFKFTCLPLEGNLNLNFYELKNSASKKYGAGYKPAPARSKC